MTVSHPAFAFAAVFALSFALAGAPALAGSIVVAPGATGQIDVGDRYSYTTINITNEGGVAGKIEIGGKTHEVPAGGKIEIYDRYGRSTIGGTYIYVTNTGTVPLHLISRYQMTYMTQ